MCTDTKNVFWGLDENAPQNEIGTPRCASPNFKWYKDGKEFEASERFQVQFDDQEDTIALIFQHVKPGDAGLYTCVASTGTEKISCSAELSVQGVVKGVQPIAQEAEKGNLLIRFSQFFQFFHQFTNPSQTDVCKKIGSYGSFRR